VFSSLRRLIGKPSADDEGGVDGMAVIIGFFRALFQLRDRRFRRVLIRSVAYSAVLIVGFGLGAGWLALVPPGVPLEVVKLIFLFFGFQRNFVACPGNSCFPFSVGRLGCPDLGNFPDINDREKSL
jgi:hypothetical protein